MSKDPEPYLPELQAKFPKARFHYEPTPNCKYCGGSGIRTPRKLSTGHSIGESPCACLFLGPNTEAILPLITKSAKTALKEMASETKQ